MNKAVAIIVAVVVVAGGCVVGGGAVALLLVAGFSSRMTPSTPVYSGVSVQGEMGQPKREPMPRQEFLNLVNGKTHDELTKALGKPDKISSSGTWSYDNATRDEITGKIDFHTTIYFKGDPPRAESIGY